MADLPYYNVGTATLTVGSTSMVGQGTLWLGNARPGDVVYPQAGGGPYIVANVVDNTHIDLLFPATVAQAAQPYAVMYTPDDPYTQTELRKILKSINASSLVALSNLVPTARKGVRFDGAANAALIEISDLALQLLDDTTAAAMRVTIEANNASNLTTGTIQDALVSGTLPANKAYRRGNILGGVAVSGGVPTGAIIENGAAVSASEISRYIRWADGTQFCLYSYLNDFPVSIAPGALITLGPFGFLAAFASPSPFIDYSGYVTDPGGNLLSLSMNDASPSIGAGTTQFMISIRNTSNLTASRIISLRMLALGRWF